MELNGHLIEFDFTNVGKFPFLCGKLTTAKSYLIQFLVMQLGSNTFFNVINCSLHFSTGKCWIMSTYTKLENVKCQPIQS